jgi:hypothetical protein
MGAALKIRISAGRQTSATAEMRRVMEPNTVELLSITNLGSVT